MSWKLGPGLPPTANGNTSINPGPTFARMEVRSMRSIFFMSLPFCARSAFPGQCSSITEQLTCVDPGSQAVSEWVVRGAVL
jgi:hypothetical protein